MTSGDLHWHDFFPNLTGAEHLFLQLVGGYTLKTDVTHHLTNAVYSSGFQSTESQIFRKNNIRL